MPSASPERIRQLLSAWPEGDQAALTELTPLVHEDLRQLAHHYMSGQRPDHTLQTTALVNEVYLRLGWPNQSQLAGTTPLAARICLAVFFLAQRRAPSRFRGARAPRPLFLAYRQKAPRAECVPRGA